MGSSTAQQNARQVIAMVPQKPTAVVLCSKADRTVSLSILRVGCSIANGITPLFMPSSNASMFRLWGSCAGLCPLKLNDRPPLRPLCNMQLPVEAVIICNPPLSLLFADSTSHVAVHGLDCDRVEYATCISTSLPWHQASAFELSITSPC